LASRPLPPLRARALRFLARREHSRAELGRKLAPLAAGGDDVEALLDDFTRRGWLSDARFAEQTIRARSRRFGPVKVAHDLRAKGVAEDEIDAAFRAAGEQGAADIARVWASHFSQAPADQRERARQVRFLQGRGFTLGAILLFMKRTPDRLG
jgi:regulatory protein